MSDVKIWNDEVDGPQNFDEVVAVVDLLWGDHPELKTVGDVRAAADALLAKMRGDS